MKKTFVYLLLFTAIYRVGAQSAFTNVLISDVVNPNEPTICINPLDTNRIAAAANTDVFYYSDDAGLHWNTGQATSFYGVFGDPCIVADTAGDFLYFHLAYNPNITEWPQWCDRIVCQKTADGGTTWYIDTFMGLRPPKMQDKEWAAVDPAHNYVYCGWTEFEEYGTANPTDSSYILFSRSTDGGASWSTAKVIGALSGDCVDSDSTIEGAFPAVGPNGEVYLAYALNNKIYFNRSTDFGTTWLSSEVVVANQNEGWDYTVSGFYRCNGMPILHCDLSNSINRGTLYLNWSDKVNATDADVYLSKSIDGGSTWSLPIRVNDDAGNAENFMSSMAVDQDNGDIYIVYYDRRNHPQGTATDVYLARSIDGGQNFNNYLLSNSPFIAADSVFPGDYIGISAVNGCVRPIWTRIDTGHSSVWTALVNFPPHPVSVQQNSVDALFQLTSGTITNGPVVLSIGEIESAAVVELFDATGQLIVSYPHLQALTYLHLRLQAFNLAPGTYYLRCTTSNRQQALRLIYTGGQ
ncbi:MAG: hypothetical protein U0T75_09885 [Chitinophagales bacterium]